jgi:putative transposase
VSEFVGQPQKKIVKQVAGIDLGLKDFATITDGSSYERIKPPKFFYEFELKLAKAQKKLSRCKKGSKNRAKAKLEVSKLHKRITSLRNNWLHQLTKELANRFDAICLEDLNLKGMMRSNLGKSLVDAALAEFVRQLKYKLKWLGKYCQQVDRWFPSSKLCAECGVVNKELTLSDRTWTCECGLTHDRDENAARNIRTEGLSLLTSGSDSPTLKLLRKGKTNKSLAPSVDARIRLL